MFRTTIFRQAQFAEFEEKAHEFVEKDIPIIEAIQQTRAVITWHAIPTAL